MNSTLSQVLGPSWRTSLGGYAIIALAALEAGAAVVHGRPINWTEVMVHIAAGSALLQARDNKVTSEQAGAK